MDELTKSEKQKKWFLLLKPLISARKKRTSHQKAKLISVLFNKNGIRTWKDIKKIIEIALKNVANTERIFSRTSQIKGDPDPDGVIDDMFAELRAIPYLLHKGFKNIRYNKNNVDFIAEFDGIEYVIEVAYIRGPSFKTQKIAPVSSSPDIPVYSLGSKKLINRFKSCYDKKKEQISKHGYNENNSMILLITDLEETFEPWLNHDLIQKEHPINLFVMTREIPTIVFGRATIYEPEQGVFDILNPFKWEKFQQQFLESNF